MTDKKHYKRERKEITLGNIPKGATVVDTAIGKKFIFVHIVNPSGKGETLLYDKQEHLGG